MLFQVMYIIVSFLFRIKCIFIPIKWVFSSEDSAKSPEIPPVRETSNAVGHGMAQMIGWLIVFH